MIACQCALARLVTLEVDWPLWRDSYSSVSPTYVERDRLNGNTVHFLPLFVICVVVIRWNSLCFKLYDLKIILKFKNIMPIILQY